MHLCIKEDFENTNPKYAEALNWDTDVERKRSFYYCSLHKWMLAAYSIEIVGNYSVTCWDSIWSHLLWKIGTEFIIYYTVLLQGSVGSEKSLLWDENPTSIITTFHHMLHSNVNVQIKVRLKNCSDSNTQLKMFEAFNPDSLMGQIIAQ